MNNVKSQFKILYLHGLDSQLSEEKNDVLKSYGKILSPSIDYKINDQIIDNLYLEYKHAGVEVVIGSSFGGFAAYYLSLLLNAHCLIFNPALPYRSFPQNIPIVKKREKELLTIIGVQDLVIKATDNIRFLLDHQSENEHSRIHVLQDLAHQIPLTVFSREIDNFIKNQLNIIV